MRERAIRLHIVSHIGATKLSVLNPSHVDAWLSDLEAKRAKQNAFVTLKIALNYAVRELGILDRNPIANLKKPSASKAEQHIPTLPELKRLLEAAKETPSYAFIFLAIATSMRFGELTALSWHDVDLKQGMLYVRQGVGTVYDDESESGYRREVTDTKSTAGRRRIDLSPEAIGVLKEHRKVQDGQRTRTTWLSRTVTGALSTRQTSTATRGARSSKQPECRTAGSTRVASCGKLAARTIGR